MEVRQFTEGCEVEQALVVRAAEMRQCEGREFLRLSLGDRTGCVTATVHEEVDGARAICCVGSVVWVHGHMRVRGRQSGSGSAELAVSSVRAARPAEYAEHDLVDGPAREPAKMEADLRELLGTVRDPWLSELLGQIFGEGSAVWAQMREAPAAKRYHQAYRHGLLEHCLTVAQAVSAVSATFPGIDRDVAVTGALLHDIGKLDAYEVRGAAIEMSDSGRLYGEIPLGYYRVRSMIEAIDGFPDALARGVLHIILSHHGSLEHGSPVIPCTREATLVHMIDNLGGRLGSFDRLEKELPEGSAWSPYDRALGGGAYFAPRTQSDAALAADLDAPVPRAA